MIGRTARTWGGALLLLACAALSEARAASAPAQVYEHPQRKYAVTVPAGARIREPGDTVDIAIDSDKGYGVILQTSDAGPDTTISETAATLEAAYLGPGKPWERKIGQEVSLIAGMVAFSGQYEGQGARYHVVITRGPVNAYTFIFRARSEAFDTLEPEFHWILNAFRLAPGDMPPTPAAPEAARPKPGVEQAVLGAEPSVRRFAEHRLGYAIEYDPEWVLERPTGEAIMVSGPEGTDAFYATVSIQNVAPPDAETAVQAASMAMDQIRVQFEKQAKDVIFERQGPYVYKRDEVFLVGQEFAVAYSQGKQTYRQWSVVVPRPEGKVAYIWSYRAPADRFARHMKTAERILGSWVIAKPDQDAERR
ncbi:hypothetical protein [Shumkonia mesophila]|uniref:hypothetical protein n=1 Tax=Shumkonia mesophila TaxID=2838854 RepID=UPI0029348779|nr:hypothetical protein [Shumkonia mesophila]